MVDVVVTIALRSFGGPVHSAFEPGWRHATTSLLSVSTAVTLSKTTHRDAYVFYRYCLVGIAVMVAGVIYWAFWRIVFPRIFGYELVPTKEVLSDGTVVTIVSPMFGCSLPSVHTDLVFSAIQFTNKANL